MHHITTEIIKAKAAHEWSSIEKMGNARVTFNFDSWKQAVIGSAQGSTSDADLLDASGLTEGETLPEAFEAILDELEKEIEEAKRRLDRDD